MKKKFIIILFASFLLICVSTCVNGISTSKKPINISSQIDDGSSNEIGKDDSHDNLPTQPMFFHADANGPYSGSTNEPIEFSSLGTNILKALSYEWDFDDDTDYAQGYGKNPTHCYSEPGVYYVTLTVTDSQNNVYKDIAPVYIDCIGNHLKPYGGRNYYASADEPIKFDASKSVSTGAEIIEYFWDFGDGTTAYGETVIHQFKEERVYMVTLDVMDKDGISRHDVLHADIGITYSDEKDFFYNSNEEIQDVLDFLFNRLDYTPGVFSGILKTKIYTNYNGNEKWTQLAGLSPLPKEIDVNDNGIKDIKLSKIKYFKVKKAPSMFKRNSRIWYQFETTLSGVNKISGDIKAEDDFTVCLELDFGFIADKLGLDDTIIRIGYNSPSGEEMPDSISITHILRPYLLFRILGWDNARSKGVKTDVFFAKPAIKNSKQSQITTSRSLFTQASEPTLGKSEIIKSSTLTSQSGEIFQSSQDLKETSGELTEHNSYSNFDGKYWPEYGLRISSSGGGNFFLVSMILNGIGSSKTTVKINYGSSTSSLIYKRGKTGGILNHAAVFEIPGDNAILSIIREKNNGVTELSTGFSFSSNLRRWIGWSDSGFAFSLGGETSVDIHNFYFDNPTCNLTFNKIALDAAGYIDFGLIDGVKLELDGNGGFILSDLSFNVKTSGLNIEIIGTLIMDVDGFIHLALASGLLEVGFEGDLFLSSDCKFKTDDETVTTGGNFYLGSDGIIAFSWDSDQFTIDLDSGLLLKIENLNFVVGDLIANASLIEIGASGKFDIVWDTESSEVTISGAPDVSLGLENVDITYGSNLNVKVIGAFNIAADGYITFGPNIFRAGFSGLLDLGSSCEFEINGEGLRVGGLFELAGENGEISFSWDEDEFTLDVSGSPQLNITDLYFEIGDLTVAADNVGIGASGQFNIVWDTTNEEVTINGGSGASLAITNVDIKFESSISIRIIGSLEIQADGYITFGPDTFIAGFTGSLDLGSECEFEINGETIKAGGLFTLSSGNGEIGFIWADDEFTLYVSGSPELTVDELYFEVGNFRINSKYVGICASGNFKVEWDIALSEITIHSGIDSALEIEDLNINYGDSLSVQIIGAFDIQADGYITFAPGVFKAGFSGTLDLGISCEFVINGESISAGGAYTLIGGHGEIEFNWADDQFNLYVSGAPSLDVSNLFFEAGDLTINAEYVGIGVSGEFNIEIDIAKSEIKISSGGGVSLQLTDLDITLGSSLDVTIIGSIEIQANGYIIFAPGVFRANFEGTLNLGTGGAYCQFEINGDSIKIGGEYTLFGGSGEIFFEWSDNQLILNVEGSPELDVSDLYFEVGDFKVTGDNIGIGVSGAFNVDLDTGSNEVTISGTSGISLSVENINISYGTTLDVKIFGSFEIQAGGYITFGPGVFKTSFDGTLVLGTQTQFEINGDSITVGGIFTLVGENGEISFSWEDGAFSLEVSGGPRLEVEDFYFGAEIQNNNLQISVYEIEIGAFGDLTLEWFSSQSKITIRSDAGVSLLVTDAEVIYGSTIDIKIIGTLDIAVDGSVSIAPGTFEASFSGVIILSPGFGLEIDGEIITLSCEFSIPQGSGDVTVSWTDEQLSFDVSGGVSLDIKYLIFEIDTLKVDTHVIHIGVNGDFSIIFDNGIDKLEISSYVSILIEDFSFDAYLNGQWESILVFQILEIDGNGYLLIDSGTEPKIEADFNGKFKIQNLQVTPPDNWNCGLSIGSLDLNGNAKINLIESSSGSGLFDISGGTVFGQISSFNANIQLSGKDFEIIFSYLQISGNFNLNIENTFQIGGGGSLILNDLNANFGNFHISSDINLIGEGNFDGLWSNNQFELDLTVNFIWDIIIESESIGNWEAYGNLIGSADLAAEWSDTTGSIDINVYSPGVFHSLTMVHDNLNITLGEFSISPGLIVFEWYKDDYLKKGHFYINSGLTVSINIAKMSWGTKSISLGLLNVEPGEFKYAWNIGLKLLTINNGIPYFGPHITYVDTSEDLQITGSIGGLQTDYSKTMTLQWYEDNGQIVGVYVDTSNTYLAQYLQISYIKSNTGKRITIYGLQCDAFYIIKENGEFKWGGNIYIANRITFSKLINDNWRDLDVKWNFQQDEKWIRFERDPEFQVVLKLFETQILGFDISSEIDLLHGEYIEIRWDIDVTGRIFIDTNWEYIASINILIGPNFGIGVNTTIYALRAENWWIEWTSWPPTEWNVETHGLLDSFGIEVKVYFNGAWHHLWPW